ncbi:MAG: glycosyltransferase family 2 protein [Solirubrobacteraceae bacterium]
MQRPAHSTTAVVVTWRGRQWIDACLDAIRAAHDGPVLVVDNASDDGTAERLRSRTDIEVLRLPRNAGFAGGVAAAVEQVRTPFVALVNDDARVEPSFLRELLAPFDEPGGDAIGATTAKIVLEDGSINNAGSAVLPDGYAYDRGLRDPDDGRWDRVEDVEAFCGGAAVLRMAALREVGGFPAEFFLYYEDTDVSLRLRRHGWRIRYVPTARAVHRHAASTDSSSTRFHFYNERNRLLLLVRCFPAGVARHEIWRFARSIGGFALRRLHGQRPGQASERPAVRAWVLLSFLRLLPSALRARRSLGGATQLQAAS